MAKTSGSQIKDDKTYGKIREKGGGKEKAARIANAQAKSKSSAGKSKTAQKGGKQREYEDWNRGDLYNKAKQVGIEGRSKMKKGDLIDALRNH